MSFQRIRSLIVPNFRRFLATKLSEKIPKDLNIQSGILVKMCTPTKVFLYSLQTFFYGYANQIDAKTTSGDVGILPNHVPSIFLLDQGYLTIMASDKTLNLIVATGFLTVYIYVSEAAYHHDINSDLVQNATEYFNQMISHAKDETEKQYAIVALNAITSYTQFSK